MNRITQAFVPSPLHASGFHNKFRLSEYTSKDEATCFFGANVTYLDKMKAHRGHLTLIWIGMGAYNLSIGNHDVEFIRTCRNIATSSTMQRVLDEAGVVNEFYPISCFIFNDIVAEPLGDKIYFYYGGRKPELYNMDMMREIEKRVPYEVLYVNGIEGHTRKQTFDLYRQCFCGIRMREFDGLSNTGIELGLMGRMVICNGDAPNNVHYENMEDIIASLYSIGLPEPEDVSASVRKFIDIGDDWLNYGI
jgi:hypothetical protein